VYDCGTDYSFAVKDDGPGIAAEYQDQIFKMFLTLKPRDQVEGSGMGLAMVRKNIEVFGGKLSLESADGKGSVFRFTWPKHQKISEKPHEYLGAA
jgi:signal transduction histidine kinase